MFQSILNKSSTNNGLIVSDNFIFSLDINTSEQHTSKLKLTENPIESGANIADHAVLDPKEISINGLIVGYEINNVSVNSSVESNFNDYPLPMPLNISNEQAQCMVNRFASHFERQAVIQNPVVADFLPEYQSPQLNSLSSDRIADAYEKLLAIQRSGEPVILQTNAKLYKNMVLTSVGLTQKKETYGEFVLTFREIFIVETKIATIINKPVAKKNLGKTQPQKPKEEKSILYRFFRWLFS